MTKALVVLLSVAIVLGVIAYFAVFTPGTYTAMSSNPADASGTLSFSGLANDTGSVQTASNTTTTPSGGSVFLNTSSSSNDFVSTYSYPYVMNWQSGQNDFSVTGASFDGSNLVVTLKVQIGNVGSCLPVDLRLVTDESGDVAAPNESQFTFPDTNSCNATPNATYTNQTLVFPIPATTPAPWLFTTGGTSNQFFQIATSTSGGLTIQLPATSG